MISMTVQVRRKINRLFNKIMIAHLAREGESLAEFENSELRL